jgi:hypothetical protein
MPAYLWKRDYFPGRNGTIQRQIVSKKTGWSLACLILFYMISQMERAPYEDTTIVLQHRTKMDRMEKDF